MRLLSVRLILSLILAITLVSLLSSYYQVRAERRSLQADLERRAAVLAESLAGNIDPLLEKGSIKKLQGIVERFSNRERLAGVAILDTKLEPIAQSAGLAQRMQTQPSAVAQAIAQNQEQSEFVRTSTGRLHVYVLPLHRDAELIGELVIVHDASYIDSAKRARVARHLLACAGASLFDCADHRSYCALEHRWAHRAGSTVDAGLADWEGRCLLGRYLGL